MKNITTFVDNVGRVIVGQKEKSSGEILQIKEPAVVNVQVNQQSGQISVQLLPFIFREFIEPKVREEGVTWNFNKSNIVESDNVKLDGNIVEQYKSIFSKPVAQAATPAPTTQAKEPEVVKLFDE